jgi:hypothetical protein
MIDSIKIRITSERRASTPYSHLVVYFHDAAGRGRIRKGMEKVGFAMFGLSPRGKSNSANLAKILLIKCHERPCHVDQIHVGVAATRQYA